MPRVVLSVHGHYSMMKDFASPEPAGWRTVHVADDEETCLSYIRDQWTDPFLRSAPPPNKPGMQPLPADLPEGVVCPYPVKQPKLRLFVFPHAGAGPSAYHGLAKAFRNSDIEVMLVAYPGREIRYRVPAANTMKALLAEFETHLAPLLKLGRFAFYGHSMGALAAFEYTRCRDSANLSLPDFLMLTGRQAPSITGHDMPVDSLSDTAFIEAVGRRYNAIPREVLDTPELLQLLLPALRADFKLVASHTSQPAPRLPVPAILINGVDDPWISQATLQPWDKEVKTIQQHWLPGDHFFLRNNMESVQTIILNSCAESLKVN